MTRAASRHLLGLFALAFVACTASADEQVAPLPTHCRAGEFAFLNARMSEIHKFPKPKGGWKKGDSLYELRNTGKLLSICAGDSSEPPQALSYRFGPAGRVEMEHVATPSRKFRIFERSTSSHTGEEVLFFSVGPYTYCVRAATGAGQGIGLVVLKGGRTILDLFSGTETGKAYEGGLARLFEMDVASHAAPLQVLQADVPFRTPCDAKYK